MGKAKRRRQRAARSVRLPAGCPPDLARRLLRGDPAVCQALAIAGQAAMRGLDPELFRFVSDLGQICHHYRRDPTMAVLTRDARTGAYGGVLPSVLEDLRPHVPPIPDDALGVIYDTLWQAMQGGWTPPEPGGMRAVGKAKA